MPALVTPECVEGKTLVYGNAMRSDLKLLEIDDQILEEITAGRVNIKGRDDDEAVLCTASNTFALKLVETTNKLLLIGKSTVCSVLCGANAGAHLELLPTAPRFNTLDAILQASSYGAEDEEAAAAGTISAESAPCQKGYSFEQLLVRVQASAGELRVALRERGAVELDGVWRILQQECLGSILELVLVTSASQGWPTDSLPCDKLASSLAADGYDPRVVRHCLAQYGEETSGAAGESFASLDNSLVCLHFARKLLQGRPCWLLSDFMEQWTRNVPEGFFPAQTMLQGETLMEEVSGSQVLRHFSVSSLPEEPAPRFALLFAARPHWTREDLMPYLKGMQVANKSAEAVLLAYTRTQTDAKGIVTFCGR